ncbi:MAG: hypothetical protein DRJ29_08035 [Bacteroidetes bacterium]|nr:MAG: hypothetical protein DRJ29_08035 [Bacteroidota bacterium]
MNTHNQPPLFFFPYGNDYEGIWNFTEYGSIHLIDRPKNSIHINKLWSFIACLGSVSVFIPFFIYGCLPKRYMGIIIHISYLLLGLAFTAIYFGDFQESRISVLMNTLFLTSGSLVLIALFLVGFNLVKKDFYGFFKSKQFVIFLYLASLSLFVILFAPFSATRHILLIIPFILLLGHELIDKTTHGLKMLSMGTALLLGLLLGISDWKYADFYRNMSIQELPVGNTTWTVGQWGWKWYAQKISNH